MKFEKVSEKADRIKIVLKSGKEQSVDEISSMDIFRCNKKDLW